MKKKLKPDHQITFILKPPLLGGTTKAPRK